MYPVISLLRRFAINVVLVRPEQLEQTDEGLHLRLHTPGRHAVWKSGSWSKYAVDRILMQMVTGVGDSPEEAAITLAKKENAFAESLQARETAYTMVFGPEDQVVIDGKYHRRSRYVVLRGYFAASKGGVKGQPPKKRRVIRPGASQRLPSGVVHERR